MQTPERKLIVIRNVKKLTKGFDGPYLEPLAMWQMMPPA